MEKCIEKQFELEGLCCANCSNKIENKISTLPWVEEAGINFTTKVLTVKSKEDLEYHKIIEIQQVVDSIEDGVKVNEKGKLSYEACRGIPIKGIECRCSDEKCNDNNTLKSALKSLDVNSENKSEITKILIGILFYIGAIIVGEIEWLKLLLFIVSYIMIGGEVVIKAFKNIKRGHMFDENLLMVIATMGAFAIKQYPEAVAVMIFYEVGEMFQKAAVEKSRRSIGALMDIRPDYAILKSGEKRVSPDSVNIGELIIVRPGEKIPLDGIVVEGKSQIDTSSLTGESIPREVECDCDVLSGCINMTGVITVKVTKTFGQSTVNKILDLVENAGSKKAQTEKFITRFSRYYTPFVVIMALLISVIPPIFNGWKDSYDWIYRGLSFLVVSCPCALVISIPLGFFGGIGAGSKNGILVKGGNYLEALNDVSTIVFDKTGTLTKGVFKVTKICNEKFIKYEELLRVAAFIESYSNHPIAKSIISAYKGKIDKSSVCNVKESAGHGIEAELEGKKILVGNSKLMNKYNIEYKVPEAYGTVVHIAIDDRYAGYIVISDELKDDSIETVKILKDKVGVNTIMLTGDNSSIGNHIKDVLGIDECYCELLPQDKVNKLEDICSRTSGKVIFVGDGINDAPVLAMSDIGIAMGGIGSDAAIEAADIVIMTDEISKISKAIDIAKKTKSIVWQNILFSLGIKAVILILVAMGVGTMWEAVFGDVGVTIIAVLNSMRILKA